MIGHGGEGARPITSSVTGHSAVFEQDFNGARGYPHVDMLFDELEGHTVEVAIHLDMIIDIDLGFFPFSIFKGPPGKRFKSRLINRFKKLFTAARQFLEGGVVEFD